jgi:hypothetical protein
MNKINILSGSNAPETTNCMMGLVGDNDVNINVDDLTVEQKAKFDDFFSSEMKHFGSITILNAPIGIDLNRVTPLTISNDEFVVDYDLASLPMKNIIDSFISIF